MCSKKPADCIHELPLVEEDFPCFLCRDEEDLGELASFSFLSLDLGDAKTSDDVVGLTGSDVVVIFGASPVGSFASESGTS